jgi:RNA polymerase sigma-70 factor (ECF subfamily)
VVPPSTGPESTVVEQLRSGLQIMALRALGDLEAAEEVVQETLVRALEALRDGRPKDPEKLGAFARGIARHVIADTRKALGRSIPLEAISDVRLDPGRDNPLTALVTAEERGRVRQALSLLSAADRQVLHLSFFDGLTPAEIAERVGEPALRIRKRKSRALRRLRRAFLSGGRVCHESSSSQTDE